MKNLVIFYLKKIIRLMGYTYMLANKKDGVIYIGITSDLENRMLEHKNKTYKGFTPKYNIDVFMRHQEFQDIQAILYEKKLKGRSRKRR